MLINVNDYFSLLLQSPTVTATASTNDVTDMATSTVTAVSTSGFATASFTPMCTNVHDNIIIMIIICREYTLHTAVPQKCTFLGC